jgi:hypothetical protein
LLAPEECRLANYEDVNDAAKLCRDPAMQWVGASPLRRRVFKQIPHHCSLLNIDPMMSFTRIR